MLEDSGRLRKYKHGRTLSKYRCKASTPESRRRTGALYCFWRTDGERDRSLKDQFRHGREELEPLRANWEHLPLFLLPILGLEAMWNWQIPSPRMPSLRFRRSVQSRERVVHSSRTLHAGRHTSVSQLEASESRNRRTWRSTSLPSRKLHNACILYPANELARVRHKYWQWWPARPLGVIGKMWSVWVKLRLFKQVRTMTSPKCHDQGLRLTTTSP